MKNDLISVIVPIYNAEKYLKRCIESIINQTYSNIEIILVNDGSLDKSIEICNKYAKIDTRIKIINKENGGASSARNAGISISNGKYISFVDCDDYIEPELISKLLQNIDNYNLSVCAYNIVDSNKIIKTSLTKKQNDFQIDNKEFINNLFYIDDKYDYEGFIFNKLFIKYIINENNIRFDEDIYYNEDRLFIYKYVMCCNKISFSKYIGYNYILRKESMMNKEKYDEKMYTEIIAFEKMREMALETNDEKTNDLILTNIVFKSLIKYNEFHKKEYLRTANKYFFKVFFNTNIGLKIKARIIKKYITGFLNL